MPEPITSSPSPNPDAFPGVPITDFTEGIDAGAQGDPGQEHANGQPDQDQQATVEPSQLSPIQAARLALGPRGRESSPIKPLNEGDEPFVFTDLESLRAGKDPREDDTPSGKFWRGRGGIGTAREEIANRFPEKG